MARPSNLTPEQWEEIKTRLLKGEKAADLSREYGVSKSAISVRVSKRVETVKAVANQLVSADRALRDLPVSEQLRVITLADELRSISMHAAGAAKFGMATSHRMAGIANALVQQVDDSDPLASMEALKAVSVITKIGNEAAHVGLNLLAANKGIGLVDPPPMPGSLPENVIDAAAVYARIMGA